MRKLTILCCGAAAAATLLAGCGGQAATDTGGQSHASHEVPVVSSTGQLLAAFTSSDKQTAHITFSIKTDQGTFMSGKGAYRGGDDFGMRMSMDMDAAMMADDKDHQGGLTGKTVTMSMIMLDDAIYMKTPDMQGPLTDGKPWVKLDLAGGGMFAQAFSSMLKNVEQQNDPHAILDKLKQAGTIHRHATEQLNGQQVTHYWITVNTAKAMKYADNEFAGIEDPQLRKQLEQAQQKADKLRRKLMPKTRAVQLWTNHDNLPVKFLTKMPIPKIGTMMTCTVTYSDWGEPVTIKAPPADQVATLKLPEH